MFSFTNRILAHQWRVASRALSSSASAHRCTLLSSAESASSSSASNNHKHTTLASMLALMTAVASTSVASVTFLDTFLPTSGDVLMMQPVKEPATGILFPKLCNGMTLVGTGVRVKWGLIKVYAVGTYMDPVAMSAHKSASPDRINDALLNPMYPRTIRIVMARSLGVAKFTSAIVEALEPRMKGNDLETLEEFKALNPPVDLIKGAEIEMTIRGDTMMYKNATGGVGRIQSQVFCEALLDTYYGDDAVSPTHKQACLEGVKTM